MKHSFKDRYFSVVLLGIYVCLAACSPDHRPEPGRMDDRMIHLLISENLAKGLDDNDVAGKLREAGRWMRSQIATNPEVIFLLQSEPMEIKVNEGIASFQLNPKEHKLLADLHHFFGANKAVEKSAISTDRIRKAVMNRSSVTQILELIQIDKAKKISETGGVVSIHPVRDELTFLAIESDNERAANDLLSADDDLYLAADLISKYKGQFPYMDVQFERALNVIKEEDDAGIKISHWRTFRDLFIVHSRYSYILSQDRQFAAIATRGLPGYYLGLFHVHPPDNRPSAEDRLESIVKRSFIIVPIESGGFEVHYQFMGTEAGNPPVIIHYPPSDD